MSASNATRRVTMEVHEIRSPSMFVASDTEQLATSRDLGSQGADFLGFAFGGGFLIERRTAAESWFVWV